MKKFKLKDSEKVILKKWGNTDEDILQIEEGTNYAVFKTKTDKPIDWLTAKRIVGTTNFLSGISRAAFHFSCFRCNDKNHANSVYFDFSYYLKS